MNYMLSLWICRSVDSLPLVNYNKSEEVSIMIELTDSLFCLQFNENIQVI